MSNSSEVKQKKNNGNGNGKYPKSNKVVIKRMNQKPRNKALKAPFLDALIHPFWPSSMGIRCPDPFPFPTASYHLHQTHVMGNTAGSGCVAFFPNVVLSAIDIGGVSATVNASLNTTGFTRYSSTTATVPFNILGSTTPTNLSSILSTQRVVSWGIKISNLQPELSATGRIIVAVIPLGDTIPSYRELTQVGLSANVIVPILGVPVNNLFSSNILQLPTAQEFAVQDLLHGDLEVTGMYTNSSFWQFKTNVDSIAILGSANSGDSLVSSSLGVVIANGYKDITRCCGASSIVVYFEGFPTTTTNNILVETIYHIEGSPQLAANASNIPVASCAEQIITGSTSAVEASMSVASKMNNVFTWITKGADFLARNSETITNVATIGGQVARVANMLA